MTIRTVFCLNSHLFKYVFKQTFIKLSIRLCSYTYIKMYRQANEYSDKWIGKWTIS